MADERRDARSFGLTVGTVLALLGGYWTFRGRLGPAGPLLLIGGTLLLLLGAAAPRLLTGPRRAWTALAEVLASVTTFIVLFAVFALVVTPIGVARRLLGADPLRRRAPLSGSAWHPYPARHLDRRHYEKTY